VQGIAGAKTILVIDDDAEIRESIRAALEDEYTVLEAASGEEAITLLVNEPMLDPCLVVVDVNMPRMSGFEFLALTKCYVRLSRIPVMVITGRVAHARTIAREGTSYLLKPFSAEQLIEKVGQVARSN
jgi:CheY-like chemotaxis protein